MNIPVPDNSLSEKELYERGYTLDDLYPISSEVARDLRNKDFIIYKPHSNTEDGYALLPNDEIVDGEIYGVDKIDWDDGYISDFLYGKALKEYNTLLEGIRTLTPDGIIERSYEIAIKDELMAIIEFKELDLDIAMYLSEQSHPLDYIYNEWLDNDLSIQEVLEQTIRNIQDEEVFKQWRTGLRKS